MLHHRIVLVAHGIDTISNVYINDVLVGSTENMFVRYLFDIKPYLKVGATFKAFTLRENET